MPLKLRLWVSSTAEASITIRPWGSSQRLFRIHPGRYGATEFNVNAKGEARFSPLVEATGQVIPTMYAGSSLDCALMETVFHDVPFVRGPKLHSKAKHVAGKIASALRLSRDLLFVDLTSVALHKLGIPPENLTRTGAALYRETRAWALAVHQEQSQAEGLLWTSRQDDTAFALVLFGDRIQPGTLEAAGESFSLILPDGSPRAEVQTLAQRLDVLLV